MAVALARPAQRAEPVDGPLVEPDEMVAVVVALRLIADAAKGESGGYRVEGCGVMAMRSFGNSRHPALDFLLSIT